VSDNWSASSGLPTEGGVTNGQMFFRLAYDDNVDAYVNHSLPAVLRPGYKWGHCPVSRFSVSTGVDGYRENSVAAANARDIAVGPPCHDFPIHSTAGGTNSPHQAATGAGGSTADPAHTQANAVMGARFALACLRALGLDNSQNPTVNTATRSADGTKITVTFNLPNGGGLTSRAPTALTQFLVSENSGSTYARTGFSTAIVGNTVELTKTSGTWAAVSSLRMRFQSNPLPIGGWASGNGPNTSEFAAELALCNGVLYETWDGDALGLGIEVAGAISGGKWVATQDITLTPTQA
jgi:hypothetical protein